MPVIDVADPAGTDAIGDRAYGQTPDEVAILGRAACEGLIAGGVLPVLKHIPGHGRALVDSHHESPVVDACMEDLLERDFAPFRALSDMPLAMTAHVIYAAIDARRPATLSRQVMKTIVRETIGFDGLVMSDDISMKALSGDLDQRARRARKAGCDVVLHCSGDMAEMKAVAKGLDLLYWIEDDVPRAIFGDMTRLRQVFINLINNAVKFTERGEVDIMVRVQASGDGKVLLRFAVRDTGIGLTPQQMAQLFQSFQQADSSTTRKYGGTGLGLIISKRLCELMGGSISVDSKPAEGTTFRFSILTDYEKGDTAPPMPMRHGA
eukprot:gene20022-39612_t